MTDAELRAIVLQKFYDDRHVRSFTALPVEATATQEEKIRAANICRQLDEHGLIEWKGIMGEAMGMGRITARGVDVVERTVRSPITISFHDQSVSVTGSTHVQIGNSNVSNVSLDIGKLIAAIDGSTASDGEKAEAKGLIEKITSNPLVVAAFGSWLGSGSAH